MSRKRAIIIGAGPAGLTAAYELLTRTAIRPVVLEQDNGVGGISRTVNVRGNRIDIGGHRFFSKSDRVMEWWLHMLPLQNVPGENLPISYQRQSVTIKGSTSGPDPAREDDVMLLRPRRSRIYYNRKFFEYPVTLSANTVANLGLLRTGRIGLSYLHSQLRPTPCETNLEQFLVNRFGRELYLTFFKSYTEKVWGVPCHEISAEWGAQRIKGLSVGKAVYSALAKPFRGGGDLGQKGVETSLIEQFLYPKFGPGQMWEKCAARVEDLGGRVLLNRRVEHIRTEGDRVVEVVTRHGVTGEQERFRGDHFFSTMPVTHLVRALQTNVPKTIRTISEGLVFRDFVTVGLLLPELKIRDRDHAHSRHPSDTWVYIQDPDVHLGRLQIFNNWSPWMVADPETVWVGLEYFCSKGDAIWSRSDEEMTRLGIEELSRIGVIDGSRVLDSTVIRVPKAYPAYFGSYDRFPELRSWLDTFRNLFLLGRNGMHRYNNQDHSMLTAMVAVDNLAEGKTVRRDVWKINSEQDYHEAV